MTPDPAVEAAAKATADVYRCGNCADGMCPICIGMRRGIYAAAMPAIREALAEEVIKNGPVLNYELNHDGTEDTLRAAYVEAFRDASAIVRGGTP